MENPRTEEVIPGSFRDPSGFLFRRNGLIYRQVSTIYRKDYEHLMHSGLYESLVSAEQLIPHEEVAIGGQASDRTYKVLRPEPVPFVSYPYEWSFSQLQDAALLTLNIQKKALEFGMSLKDCSAYNVQFHKGKPMLIDTLSFERYREGKPWDAYRQFCQHFLAPLALMSHRDVRLSQLLRIYIDGVPLDLASVLLPHRTRLSLPLLSHIHLHAGSQRRYANRVVDLSGRRMGKLSFLGLIASLEAAVTRLHWQPKGTEWATYYESASYSDEALGHKREIVDRYLDKASPETVWDLGANIGIFSRLASDKGIFTIAFDADPAAVDKNYRACVERGEAFLLPLLLDLTNPSPGIGWENRERTSLIERGPADTAFSLALIHHLAIANNLPFDRIASFLSQVCKMLIIEFVPKEDPQVQRLLSTRKDIFANYTQQGFESEFAPYFAIVDSAAIKDSNRVLYLMARRNAPQ